MARIPVAQRRRELIDAAVEVIATHGIDGATTRRVADQADANVAMVHYCYDSKEDLFADVFEFVSRKYREVIEVVEVSDSPTTLPKAAEKILRSVMECYLGSRNFTAATFELINWARRQHGDRGVAVYDQALDALRKALHEASASDPVPAELIDEVAYVMASLADGFGVNWLTYGDASVARAQMDINCSVLEAWIAGRLSAVTAKPARRKRAVKA